MHYMILFEIQLTKTICNFYFHIHVVDIRHRIMLSRNIARNKKQGISYCIGALSYSYARPTGTIVMSTSDET